MLSLSAGASLGSFRYRPVPQSVSQPSNPVCLFDRLCRVVRARSRCPGGQGIAAKISRSDRANHGSRNRQLAQESGILALRLVWPDDHWTRGAACRSATRDVPSRSRELFRLSSFVIGTPGRRNRIDAVSSANIAPGTHRSFCLATTILFIRSLASFCPILVILLLVVLKRLPVAEPS